MLLFFFASLTASLLGIQEPRRSQILLPFQVFVWLRNEGYDILQLSLPPVFRPYYHLPFYQ